MFTDPKSLSKSDIEHGTIFAPKFDANGLVTAITIDAQDKSILMVAFMNAEAIALTLQTGFAHYYSRSRQSLWKKGETSGELQELVELRTDCDQDAIIMSVHQTGRGAACHTGHKSCFYRKIELVDGQAVLTDAAEPILFDPKNVYGT